MNPWKEEDVQRSMGLFSFCFVEFSMRLHIESCELCCLGSLLSKSQAPQQPFVPDLQGAHYAQGFVFLPFHSGKGKSMGNLTVVRRWVC